MNRLHTIVFAVATAAVLFACSDKTREESRSRTEILADSDPAVTPDQAITLQEQPPFPIDGANRPYALVSDGEKRQAGKPTPVRLDESKPVTSAGAELQPAE